MVGDNSKQQLGYKKGAPPMTLVDDSIKGLTVKSSNPKISDADANKMLEANVDTPAPYVGNSEVTFTFNFPKMVTLDGFTFATYMYGPSTGEILSWKLKDENYTTIINAPSVNTGGNWAILKGNADKIILERPGYEKDTKSTDIIKFTPHASKTWHFTAHFTKKVYIYFVRFHGCVGGTAPKATSEYSTSNVKCSYNGDCSSLGPVGQSEVGKWWCPGLNEHCERKNF